VPGHRSRGAYRAELCVVGPTCYEPPFVGCDAAKWLARCVEVACNAIGLDLKGARVAVQGFGAVGKHAARFLSQKSCVLVACSDSSGTLASPSGLDVSALISLKNTGKPVTDLPCGDKAGTEAIIDIPCDIWIPAARPDVLNKENAGRLKARIVAQGANIPCTPEAEAILESRGILVLPDFVVNAGGVICAATEYHGGNESRRLCGYRRENPDEHLGGDSGVAS
jgi:glutamate dehydrogenase (NAD(P)+)